MEGETGVAAAHIRHMDIAGAIRRAFRFAGTGRLAWMIWFFLSTLNGKPIPEGSLTQALNTRP
jgi:hypothetical protein